MALLQREGSIHVNNAKYPDDTQDSNNEKIEGDTLSVFQSLLGCNVLCEVTASTEEMTKQLKQKS